MQRPVRKVVHATCRSRPIQHLNVQISEAKNTHIMILINIVSEEEAIIPGHISCKCHTSIILKV